MEETSVLNLFKFTYPQNWNVALYLLGEESEQKLLFFHDYFTKAIFACGWAGLAYFSCSFLLKPLKEIYFWYKSFGNAKAKLKIEHDRRNKKKNKVYVVVYGA